MSSLRLLFLIPVLPLVGTVILGMFGRRLSENAVATIGVGSVGLCACIVFWIGFSAPHLASGSFVQTLWTWFAVGNLEPTIGLRLDALSGIMVGVVAVVGFLIHLYSVEFMRGDDGYSRFFAYMNLFIASMMTLVLADNLLLLFLGWEGVGLCSYLLIGFWYKDSANGRAARKAFVVTRVGDTAMILGLIFLFLQFGTLDIQQILAHAAANWRPGAGVPCLAAALLLGGALGKSAQVPLQVWLPDAMAGPSPVSALIHAATMVTAGVYLIARMHTVFTLAPPVQLAVAVIGAVTLFLSGLSALNQTDIKRVLAYSTISQIGYMFLALGVGAWSAAIFHFMTHAFFKSLLFLAAGSVILGMDEEHSIFKMGGLWRRMPFVFWPFLAGAASLAALPVITAGFYSKDLILSGTYEYGGGAGIWLWIVGITGAGITSLYTFRMVFLVFFGKSQRPVVRKPGICMKIPLVILGLLSLFGALIRAPDFLREVLPVTSSFSGRSAISFILPPVISVVGLVVAGVIYLNPRYRKRSMGVVQEFWRYGWGFDFVYDWVWVRPFYYLARANKRDVIDRVFDGISFAIRGFHRLLSWTQTGRVRFYAAAIVLGTVIFIGLVELI